MLRLLMQVYHHSVSTLEQAFLHLTQPARHLLAPAIAADLPRSTSQLIAENPLLHQRLIILSHQAKKARFTPSDRLWLVLLARRVQHWKDTLLFLKPATLLR